MIGVNRRKQVVAYIEQTLPPRVETDAWAKWNEARQSVVTKVPAAVEKFLVELEDDFLFRQLRNRAANIARDKWAKANPEPKRWQEIPERERLVASTMAATDEADIQAVLAETEKVKATL